MRTYFLVVNPMEPLFRKMLAASAGLHVAALVLGVAWTALHAPPARFISVAVVDLVGGEAFAPPPPPAVERGRPDGPAAAPAKEAKTPKEAAKSKAPPPRAAKAVPESPPKDVGSLAESIRRMREERSSSENVREAVTTIRREKAARSAIHQIGERVAHRVDLSSVRHPPKGTPPPSSAGGIPGAVGTARVPPEHLAYFRKLDERIRSNWTVPPLSTGDAEQLMVQLRIVIEMDGRVSRVLMEKTSGSSFFDDSVLRAINKASPLPVPPEQLRGAEDHYEVGFRFYGAGGAS